MMIIMSLMAVLLCTGAFLILDNMKLKLRVGESYTAYAMRAAELGDGFFIFQIAVGTIILIFILVIMIMALNNMKDCDACGKAIIGKAKYCPHCGHKLEDDIPKKKN